MMPHRSALSQHCADKGDVIYRIGHTNGIPAAINISTLLSVSTARAEDQSLKNNNNNETQSKTDPILERGTLIQMQSPSL